LHTTWFAECVNQTITVTFSFCGTLRSDNQTGIKKVASTKD